MKLITVFIELTCYHQKQHRKSFFCTGILSCYLPFITSVAYRNGQGWQVVAKVVFTTGFNRLKPAGKNPWWQKVAKSGKKSNEDN